MSDRTGIPNHSPDDLERALAAWIRLGTADAAQRETGIQASTLRAHKTRHPERFAELKETYERELQERRRSIAVEVIEGVREATLVCRRLHPAQNDDAVRDSRPSKNFPRTSPAVVVRHGASTDPELAVVVAAWADPPAAVRAFIVAIVRAARAK